MSDHFIYVIATRIDGKLSSPIKVGITSNWRARLKQVQTGSAHKVDVAFLFSAPDKHVARELERAFHATQAERRMSGEWFDLNPWKAIGLMCLAYSTAVDVKLQDWSEEDKLQFLQLAGVLEAWEFLGIERPLRRISGAVH